MQNPGQRRSHALRMTLLTVMASGVISLPALAKDLPPTADGAQKLSAIFETYLGKPAAGAASPITVVPEDGHYDVAVDLAAMAAPLRDTGFSLDPAIIKYQLTEQDDGTWRVAGDAFPSVSLRVKDVAEAIDINGYKFEGIFDPALAVFKSSQLSFDSQKVKAHGPRIDETIDFNALKLVQSATAATNGAVSLAAHEDFGAVAMAISVTPANAAPDAKPVPVSVQSDAALADIGLDGVPMRKALDIWAFVVAHPNRAELAANEPAFKELLRAFVSADFKLTEKAELKQISVEAPQGRFGLTGAKLGVAAASAHGAKSSAEYDLAMDGLSLPAGLLPPAMSDLAPTAFNIDVKASGFELGAGAEEAINDMHFAGDGPIISEADRASIFAKMKGAAPIVIELLPSHIVGPQIDLTVEGQVHIEGVRPSGTVKVHVRNFDKTIAAIKALGPLATPQMLGGMALARTLGKPEGDDGLIWIAEYGPDGSIKVNGLPLGKAP